MEVKSAIPTVGSLQRRMRLLMMIWTIVSFEDYRLDNGVEEQDIQGIGRFEEE